MSEGKTKKSEFIINVQQLMRVKLAYVQSKASDNRKLKRL